MQAKSEIRLPIKTGPCAKQSLAKSVSINFLMISGSLEMLGLVYIDSFAEGSWIKDSWYRDACVYR